MNPRPVSARSAANPFSVKTVLALVLFGAAAFVALLWMIGTGSGFGGANDGGSHAGSKGLTGYAALAELLEQRGYRVARSRSPAALDDPGLLILTPPQNADGAEIERIVSERQWIGPTIVITPKWLAAPVPRNTPKAERGWVMLGGTLAPHWEGFLDDVSVAIGPGGKRWTAAGLSGELPVPGAVEIGKGPGLEPLVMTPRGGMLAGFLQDEGIYPALERLAMQPGAGGGEDPDLYPLIVVFEPDLLNNYGMARRENAVLADRLVAAALAGEPRAVTFDLTLNGLGRSANLLTLAFTPPYLAATLCLLLAAIAAGWRAFLRFGPPRTGARAIAFGKRPLVANAAGLIRRSRRLHLVTQPYADHFRERIARTLALPREANREAAEAAIDRALRHRLPDAEPFSTLAARLRAARRPAAILRAAQALHSLERTCRK